MKIGVLGTGMVGQTIGAKLVELGHEVMMGSRTAGNDKAAEWVKQAGSRAASGTFADAAKYAGIVFNCTRGVSSLEAVQAAGNENLKGKILIDVSNPLDPTQNGNLAFCNTESLAEKLQREFPDTKVVKTLNTMWCGLMVNPRMINDSHVNFISGNYKDAKMAVMDLLKTFGWNENEIIDLGDITAARGTEMILPVWLRLFGATGTGAFNFKIVRAENQ